jgi:hypothetical protein
MLCGQRRKLQQLWGLVKAHGGKQGGYLMPQQTLSVLCKYSMLHWLAVLLMGWSDCGI